MTNRQVLIDQMKPSPPHYTWICAGTASPIIKDESDLPKALTIIETR